MRIAVIGVGNMGSWLIKQLSPVHQIVAYDLRQPPETQAGVKWLSGMAELRSIQPQLLINAVSLQNTLSVFRDASAYLEKDCLLCDLTSVKQGLAEYYQQSGFRFVSVHPMFGPTFAEMEALREENAIIINESDSTGRELFLNLFAHLGVRVFECSFKEHDAMMAYSLTTPFVASLVFASCVDKTAVPGTTFARHKRIAQGLLAEDDHLLAEVLFNPHSISQVENITSRLEFLKHVIKGRDMEEIKKVLAKLRHNLEG